MTLGNDQRRNGTAVTNMEVDVTEQAESLRRPSSREKPANRDHSVKVVVDARSRGTGITSYAERIEADEHMVFAMRMYHLMRGLPAGHDLELLRIQIVRLIVDAKYSQSRGRTNLEMS